MVLVVFGTRMREDADLDEYGRHQRRMRELVQESPGFISIKGFVGEDGEEISIARFESDEAVKRWRSHPSTC
jgi:heme-degrading monooxygenase HmoA